MDNTDGMTERGKIVYDYLINPANLFESKIGEDDYE